MKVKLLNLAADSILYLGVGCAAIGVWLLASEILITVQKL